MTNIGSSKDNQTTATSPKFKLDSSSLLILSLYFLFLFVQLRPMSPPQSPPSVAAVSSTTPSNSTHTEDAPTTSPTLTPSQKRLVTNISQSHTSPPYLTTYQTHSTPSAPNKKPSPKPSRT